MNRRRAIVAAIACVIGASVWWSATRPLPVGAEALPSVGCQDCPAREAADYDPGLASTDALPTTAETLAKLGFETGELIELPMAAIDERAEHDAGWIRRQPRGRAVRPRTPVGASGGGTAAPGAGDRSAGAPPAGATGATGRDVSTIGAELSMRDGLIMLMADSQTGGVMQRPASGRLLLTNLSGGAYTVGFGETVVLDGLTIPGGTRIPVVGQIEVELDRPSVFSIIPGTAKLPEPNLPDSAG
ncbi:MAG TPA: hypothetical protein VEL07_22265 [Planctomycetota bacterium]|nr:hypothetical protein [Planctomycetota bacterium]